jgi:hypothetical protein
MLHSRGKIVITTYIPILIANILYMYKIGINCKEGYVEGKYFESGLSASRQ